VAWCHLHPHVFMENLLTVMRPVDGTLRWPMGDKRVGWVASDDIAAVAAKVLAEGPERHAGKNYYLSTDVLKRDGGRGSAEQSVRNTSTPAVRAGPQKSGSHW
jgi:uncharacterized protein YbjT (DUF2867 family)